MAGPTPTNVSGSRFKNDRGLFMTRSLFFEVAPDSDAAIYTLKDHDHTVRGKLFPSLYRLYMEEGDPTEYLFATKHLDSFKHWEMLCEATFFKNHVERWRRELDLKMTADNIQRIKALASTDNRSSLEAQKYIAEKKWLVKEPASKTRGRPSKSEIEKNLKQHLEHSSQVEEDFNRLRLVQNGD